MRPIPLLFFLLAAGVHADDYVNEVQGRCYATRKSYLCAKYEIFRYIDDYHLGNVSLTSDSSVKFVSIPSGNDSEIGGIQMSRQYFQGDSELVKIFKFLTRRAAKLMTQQGLEVELPEGARVVTEKEVPRGKTKKKLIILPILILLKLFKVKVLAALTLAGVIAIKKMLLAAAFFLPGAIAAIKAHCKAQQFHVVPYHAEDEHTYSHEHDDEGYGISGYGGDKHTWDKRKRYSHL